MPKIKKESKKIKIKPSENVKRLPEEGRTDLSSGAVNLPTSPRVTLTSFTVTAVIPVMSYGNIQPTIVVNAASIEEAQAFVFPVIEAMFAKYVETPRDGSSKPGFLPKSNVSVTEKNVYTKQPETVPVPPETTPVPPRVSKETVADGKKELEDYLDANKEDAPGFVKTPAFVKAENAVIAAHSLEALTMIQDQVTNSTRLTEEEKPIIHTLILKRRKEFN